MKAIFLIILLFLLCINPCWSADYYVDSDGTDCALPSDTDYAPSTASCGAGSEKVWTTVSGCVDNESLVAGDVVYIRAGTYTDDILITPSDEGSGGTYLTFKSYENEDVTIQTTTSDFPIDIDGSGVSSSVDYIKWDGRGNDNGYHITITTTTASRCFVIEYATYIYLTGLKIHNAQGLAYNLYLLSATNENSGDSETVDGVRNSTFEYLKLYDGGDYGLKVTGYGTDNNIFSHLDVYTNGGGGSGSRYGINVSGSGYEDNPPDGNVFEYCNIYNNYASGITFVDTLNSTIRYSNIYSNGTGTTGHGVGLGTDSTTTTVHSCNIYSNADDGINISASSSNLVYNNVIYDNGDEGIGISNDADGNALYNNTIDAIDADTNALEVQSSCDNTIAKNNVFWTSGSGDGVYPIYVDVDSGTWNNNLFYREGGVDIVAYYNGSSKTLAEFNALANAENNLRNAPSLVNYYPNASDDPSVNTGTSVSGVFNIDKDGTYRPQGSAWDIGAYEYIFANIRGCSVSGATME